MKTLPPIRLMAFFLAVGSLLASEPDLSKLPPASTRKDVTYANDIRPLFEASCFRCHGGEKVKGELHLNTLEGVLKGGEDGKVVLPGKPKESLLLIAVAQLDEETAMSLKMGAGGPRGPGGRPSGGSAEGRPAPGSNAGGPPPGGPGGPRGFGPPPKPLTAAEVGLVRAWIEQGAK